MYSRKALRLRGFDYSGESLYLITICTHARRCLLGAIVNESLDASSFGRVVENQIELLPERLAGVLVDAFVVMPNHVHAIVALARARQASPLRLGSVVGSLKSGSAREINALRGTPGVRVWQRGYHDHVIRDESSSTSAGYVRSNPIRWAVDPENPARTS